VDLPRTSVLIPAFNEERLLPRTLASVHQSFAAVGDPSYEIVVCDNNSTDRTAAVAHENGARVVFEPHNQIARARNAAIGHARGQWFIFLDGDTELNAPLLAATLRALESGHYCGGGSLIRFGENQTNLVGRTLTGLWNRISRTFQWAAGSYIFCLRPACEAIGGFDETLYASEELTFSRALKKWGRQRRLRFRILTDSPILPSARKMEWYGDRELLLHILRLMLNPWSIKSQKSCHLWYNRPPEKSDTRPPM
jgi:glycosyltransferase involved in cell wall biosynthesis